jgi:hypothetical protein
VAAVVTFSRRAAFSLYLATIVATVPTPGVSAQAGRPQEYQVKAAYLYSFGKFVEWPAAAPAASEKSFTVCVLGQDPFGRTLDQGVTDVVVRDEPVVVRRLSRPEDARTCHILFVSASEDQRLRPILETLAGQNVLTVGETPRFVERGGAVEFTMEGNRVRFRVNLAAAERAGLILSSELLRVASAVLRTSQPGD